MKIVYSRQASQDMDDIYDYIAYELLVPSTAEALVEKIMSDIRTLGHMPERNPLYKDEPWYSMGVRFLVVKNYLVFYLVNKDTDTVSISRIMYGGRDIRKQLSETLDF